MPVLRQLVSHNSASGEMAGEGGDGGGEGKAEIDNGTWFDPRYAGMLLRTGLKYHSTSNVIAAPDTLYAFQLLPTTQGAGGDEIVGRRVSPRAITVIGWAKQGYMSSYVVPVSLAPQALRVMIVLDQGGTGTPSMPNVLDTGPDAGTVRAWQTHNYDRRYLIVWDTLIVPGVGGGVAVTKRIELPKQLLSEVLATGPPVVYMKNNIWMLGYSSGDADNVVEYIGNAVLEYNDA